MKKSDLYWLIGCGAAIVSLRNEETTLMHIAWMCTLFSILLKFIED